MIVLKFFAKPKRFKTSLSIDIIGEKYIGGEMMENDMRPSAKEIEFLNMAYSSFYDIFEEAFKEKFWDQDPQYRFFKIKKAFEIYAELLNYEPIKWVIDIIKVKRPPNEAEIGSDLFKCIRNILSHFPFFDSWDDAWVSKNTINWNREGQTIDRFFNKYESKEDVKYRFWDARKKEMTYLTICFPKKYDEDKKIYLRDILSEKDGIKFSFILMRKILDTQVEG